MHKIIEVYVPAHLTEELEEIISIMSTLCGGATMYSAGGVWIDSDEAVQEKIVIVRGIKRGSLPLHAKDKITSVLHKAGESAVLVTEQEIKTDLIFKEDS